MLYKVINKQIVNCRIIDVKLKNNSNHNSKFVVVKLGEYNSGELLRSIIMSETTLPYFEKEMRLRIRHTIERVVIQPQNHVYHILTWDDVDKGRCTREHVGEILRDKEGKPQKFAQIVVFGNIDNKNKKGTTIGEALENNFIEVNSPFVQKYLNYNNRQQYEQKKYEKELQKQEKEHEEYDEMMNSFYEAYENRRYSEIDLTEEDKIMAALENGEGELYGF